MHLRRGRAGYALRSVIDFLLLASTAPFIVLAIYAALKGGKPVDEYEWSQLQLAMRTVWRV